MPRLYLTNDSYPELRDINRQWARTATWWRAILHAFGYGRFRVFMAAQAAIFLAYLLLAAVVVSHLDLGWKIGPFVHGGVALAWVVVFGYLQVSWGGDLMRSHLRAVSQTARYACPGCGHSLIGHVQRDAAGDPPGVSIRCPECAAQVPRELFEPPYRVPPRFRAFPPWRRLV